MLVSLILMTAVILVTILFGVAFNKEKVLKKLSSPVRTGKKVLGVNVVSLFGLMIFALTSMIPSGHAFAQSAAAAATSVVANTNPGLGFIGAGLSTGLASMGAGIGVGIAGAAGIGAISEKPEMLGRTLIYVGLAEGVAIYGLIISIMILGRI
jgi:V/A-type H+-transporting ATPase subunit K